ncbi:Glucan endo-1,3-beta-glucosidase GV [Dichanthelium oligosanthes]|uniref:Glucan endo-1,3-beta-glucosidase GV n=1 Tax=Dichanthelium oligosanthes TaxID=888268 RepID=A0A1E5V5J7_9POAL|nr:Glucan endo-1,3-beta-glucosidase GV [Dichanthelium oligosanthes]
MGGVGQVYRWVSWTLFTAIFFSFDQQLACAAGAHGVFYGVVGDNLPSRADVVQLYESRNITAMRIYYPDPEALAALRGSAIALILDVGGVDAVRGLAGSASAAAAWVQANVLPYYPDVLIRYIAVGNEVIPAGGDDDAGLILPAMRNVHAALVAAGLAGAVKVSTAVRMDVIADSSPPSHGVFSPSARRHMAAVARFLADTGAPLLANVYPYFAYRDNPRDIALAYATFQQHATAVRDDGSGLVYTNLFAAMVDAIHAALEKAGAPGVRVVVSESGWPSAGGLAATVENAWRYNQGLIDQAYRGTPKRPGVLETYVFAMFNENQKPGDPTERNFGLFYPNMQPVYPINFPN